ncbi:MAG: prepilin-type N-terminal cleavage/methylation domain-containing protein [Nitrospirae bacterium]|nr:prepilin-type N-terminal cleavage/methylation domain-containing protein [Nitrospirota bacterium]
MNTRGFTLIELLVVIAIIGILAAVAVTSYIGVQRSATRSEAYTNLDTLRLLEEDFFADNNCYEPGSPCPAGPTTYANTAAIQAFLARFQPGVGTNYTYQIIVQNGVGLPNPVPVPYAGTTAALVPATTPCFRATATGIAGTRVAGDVFAIDCNNNRNF